MYWTWTWSVGLQTRRYALLGDAVLSNSPNYVCSCPASLEYSKVRADRVDIADRVERIETVERVEKRERRESIDKRTE